MSIKILEIRRLWKWIVLSLLLMALYYQILGDWFIDLWHDDNYSHGLLIPLISLYYLKIRFSQLKLSPSRPCAAGLLLVLAGLVLYLLGFIGAEFFTRRVSLIVLLFGLILYLEGPEVMAILRFPLGILFFAVPLPYILYNAVAFPLKLVATKIAVFSLGLAGLAVFREGNIVYLTHTTLEVVDACSGIRSLMTLITLAFFLGHMMHRRFLPCFVLMLLAVPVAVFANALRVAATGFLTKFDPAWSSGTLHELTGWLVFVLSFVILWLISDLLKLKIGRPAGGSR